MWAVWQHLAGWVAWQVAQAASNRASLQRQAKATQDSSLPMSGDPRGKHLLEELAARLDQLQELDVNVRSEHLSIHNQSSELRSAATVAVKFRRLVDTWHLVGKTTQVRPWEPESGAPYELHAAGPQATLTISLLSDGKPEAFPGLIPAVEALRGVTLETANVVPDLLLPEPFEEPRWNRARTRMLTYLAEHARLVAEEAFEGFPCHRVESVRETGTWTLWIDKESLLPRGVKRTREGQQIKSSGLGLAGRITYTESMHHLEITHAK